MTDVVVASVTNGFISTIGSYIGNNLGIILTFASAIILFGIFKKWVFGGARRI